MERIRDYRFSTLIEEAYDWIPHSIARRLEHVHFLTGVDPVYVGLYDCNLGEMYDWTGETGWAAQAVSPYFQLTLPKNKRHPTIVIPEMIPIFSVIHELGHCLDEIIWYDNVPKPVTSYAKTDEVEAFAEAFVSWLVWDYGDRPDDATLALFRSLLTDEELRDAVNL